MDFTGPRFPLLQFYCNTERKKWNHFDLKSWVTGGTEIRPGIPNNLWIFESNWLDIESQFDLNIPLILGIPGWILVLLVTQLFMSKWLYCFISVRTVKKCIHFELHSAKRSVNFYKMRNLIYQFIYLINLKKHLLFKIKQNSTKFSPGIFMGLCTIWWYDSFSVTGVTLWYFTLIIIS